MLPKIECPVDSSQAANSLSAEQKSEESRRKREQRKSNLSKQGDAFLSPVKVRRKREQRNRREFKSQETTDTKSTSDNDGGRIRNHFDLKEDNDRRLFGVDEESLRAIQKGARRDSGEGRLSELGLGCPDRKAKTIHETVGERLCKLPPLQRTRNGRTNSTPGMHATEQAVTFSEDFSQLEEVLPKPACISTAGLYDLNDLQSRLTLKKNNQEGILKLNRDEDGRTVDGNVPTHCDATTGKGGRKHGRFEAESDVGDVRCTVKTVTFPLELETRERPGAVPRGKTKPNAVVLPRIADRITRGAGNGQNSHSLAYFRLDYGGPYRERKKAHERADGNSVMCRGQACFPGFASLPSLEKVADWLTQWMCL